MNDDLAGASPVDQPVRPQRTEWTEIRLALRREYGHPYTYNGVPCMDFSRHVYVGRAGALLLKAEKQEAALRELVALKDIKERAGACWPGDPEAPELLRAYSERKDAAWQAARAALGPNVGVNRRA
jgi:hypothetical protein